MFVSLDNTVRSHLQSKPGKIDKEPRKITLALTFWYRQWGLAYTALCSFRWRPGSSRLPLPGFPSYLPRQCGKGRWFSRQSKCIMAIRIKCANISLQHNIGSSELWQRTLKKKKSKWVKLRMDQVNALWKSPLYKPFSFLV